MPLLLRRAATRPGLPVDGCTPHFAERLYGMQDRPGTSRSVLSAAIQQDQLIARRGGKGLGSSMISSSRSRSLAPPLLLATQFSFGGSSFLRSERGSVRASIRACRLAKPLSVCACKSEIICRLADLTVTRTSSTSADICRLADLTVTRTSPTSANICRLADLTVTRTSSTRASTPSTMSIIWSRKASSSPRNCSMSRSHFSHRLSTSLMRHRPTSSRNCWNRPCRYSGGPLVPSLMTGVTVKLALSISQPTNVAASLPGGPAGPRSPCGPLSPATPRLPGAASNCHPGPGHAPGLSCNARNDPELSATTSKAAYSESSLNVPR